MRYYLFLLLAFSVCKSLSAQTEKEYNKEYLEIEHNISNYKFHSLNDTISYHTDNQENVVKITALINGAREYYYYNLDSFWPFIVKSEKENTKETFFFNSEYNTSLLFNWTVNGVNQEKETVEFISKDDYFFKNGRDLKNLVKNSGISLEKRSSLILYLDSLTPKNLIAVSGKSIITDTIIYDDFDETETKFTSSKSDSLYTSNDLLVTASSITIKDELEKTSYSQLRITDLGKEITTTITEEQEMVSSIRKRKDISNNSLTITFKTKENECFTRRKFTIDNTAFNEEWSQEKCD